MEIGVLIIGIIMTLSGILMLIVGYRRNAPNALLWSLFPIFHGFHEFIELIYDATGILFVERIELFFAFGSSFILLAAVIEYYGSFSSPYGKIVAAIGSIFVLYYIFFFPTELFGDVNETTFFTLGQIYATPSRFFYGFVLPVFSSVWLLASFIYTVIQNKRQGIEGIDKKTTILISIAVVLLLIFAFFEGFDSENQVFVVFRGISVALFIVIPALFLLSTKPGLYRLYIIEKSGVLIYGFNFRKNICIFCDDSDSASDRDILISGFIAALLSFSREILKADDTVTVSTFQSKLILLQKENNIYTLETRTTNKKIERALVSFANSVDEKVSKVETGAVLHNELDEQTLAVFKQFL